MRLGDTIIAPITATGGAVAVIRLSGPASLEVAKLVFNGLPDAPESHRSYYGTFLHGDDGLCTIFGDGRSYTGELSAELSIHGSSASVRSLMAHCLRGNCRPAQPGEFTWRAFANGRLDLSQAEAVRDTVEADSVGQLNAANRLRDGALRDRIAKLIQLLTKVLGAIEASVDFSEEVGEFDRQTGESEIGSVLAEIDRLLETAESGRILRRGFRIAIAGRPNAGKSSLLNALLRSNRAIVTAEEGTTRDYIEERVEIGGLPCVLIDTAGFREASNEAESAGIRTSREMISDSDMVLYLFDAVVGMTPKDFEEVAQITNPVLVATKADLARSGQGVPVSSVTGAGLADLEAEISRKLHLKDVGGIYIQDRHGEPLMRATNGCILAIQALKSDLPYDLAVTGLREAVAALGEITGETASADMIERIFADFCIGK